MPGAFSDDLTLVENAEVTTDYTLVGTLKTARALNDDYRIEGTNTMTWGVSSATGTGTAHVLAIVPGAPVDFSTSGAHFFQWIKVFAWPSMASQFNGGTRIAVSSDTTPAIVRSILSATIAAGGTGYAVGNELTLSGGTTTETAIFVVTAVSGDVVTAVTPKASARGDYTVLPTNPVSTTGAGSGCTLTVTWIYSVTNTKEWFVGGADTVVVDGWVNYVVDIAGTPDLEVGTPVLTSIDRMGVGATAIAVSKIATHAMDVSRYGTGITVNDGTAGAPVTLEDFRVYDNNSTRALGVVIAQSGIFFVAGKLKIGTTGQTAVTYFKDVTQVVVFQGFPVSSSFYAIVLAGAGSFLTTFVLGNYVAGVASGGVTIRGANRYTHYGGVATGLVPAIWTLTANAANTLCQLFGCSFSELLSAAFKSDAEIRFCTFQNFGEITAGGATFDNCSFLDLRTTAPISAVYAIRVTTTTPVITNCEFINCATAILWDRNATTNGAIDGSTFTSGGTGHAIEFGTNTPGDPSEIAFVDVNFVGYGASDTANAAVYNNSGKHVIINVSGGSTPTVRNGSGASTTVNNTVAVTFTGMKDNTEVRVYKSSDNSEVGGIEDATDGSANNRSFTWSAAASLGVYYVIHSVLYETIRVEGFTVPTSAASIPIQQRLDRNNLNP